MSTFKRRLGETDNWERVGDNSLPIRLLQEGTPTLDDYIVFDTGTGSKKTTIRSLINLIQASVINN